MNQIVDNCIPTQKRPPIMFNGTKQQIELMQHVKLIEQLMDRIGLIILKVVVLLFLGMIFSQIYYKLII